MNLKQLVKESLERNGFDGLYNDGVCACELSTCFRAVNQTSNAVPE